MVDRLCRVFCPNQFVVSTIYDVHVMNMEESGDICVIHFMACRQMQSQYGHKRHESVISYRRGDGVVVGPMHDLLPNYYGEIKTEQVL